MHIDISEHGALALKERMGCNPSKYLKLTTKAWNSASVVDARDIPNKSFYEKEKYPGREIAYRELMGRIFVFAVKRDRVVLATVYPPARWLGRPKPRVLGS